MLKKVASEIITAKQGEKSAAAGAAAKDKDGGGSNVKVMVRVRPFNKREMEISKKNGQDMPDCVIAMRDKTCIVLEHFRDDKGFAQTKEREAFSFDECFWSMPPDQGDTDKPFADNKFVYERSGLLALNNAFDGYNSTIFAYGQTGSGKTYSMTGYEADPGISPRIAMDIFTRIEQQTATNPTTKCIVECMYYEVYNEKVRDLFKKESKAGEYDAPRIRQHPTKGTYVEGLMRKECKSGEETKILLDKGSKERAMSSTKMNATSSRSHSVFQIQLTQNSAQTGTSRVSTINLVDLAGSEKVRDSGVTGEGFQEAKNINQSLSTLRKVIDCLIDNSQITNPKKKKVPPFRESVLTYVLSDSLGGNSKTQMMSAVSPHEVNTEDSLNTLRYALRAKAIVCNATVNEEKSAKMMDAMKDELRKLKEALANGDIGAGGGEGGGGRPMMPEEIKQEIEQREAEMNKMEKQQEELNTMLEESKKREEEVQQQLAEVAEQRAQLDIEIEQKKREQFASAFRSAFLITKDKKKHADQQKEIDETKQQLEDAAANAERTKKQFEEVKKETAEKVASLEKELAESEEKLKSLYSENKAEREKLRTTLQNKVNTLESELATSKEIIEEVSKESAEEISQLKSRLRGQIAQLEKEMINVKNEAEEKGKDLKAQMERQQRIANERLSETELKLAESTNENQKLRTDARSARDAARDQSQELYKQISALQQQLEDTQDAKEVELKSNNDQHSRKNQQLTSKISDLEKEIDRVKEKLVKQDRETRSNEEKLKKNHSNEISELKQQLEAETKRAAQQLTEANQQQQRLKKEMEELSSENERNIDFERNLKEEAVREIKSTSERAKSQLSRRVAELEIELQTEKAAAEQSLQAAKNAAKSEVNTLESEIESLRHQLESSENRADTLKSEKETLNKEMKELKENGGGVGENGGGNMKSRSLDEDTLNKISTLEQQLREAKESEKRAQSQLSFRTTQFDTEIKELTELNEEIRRDSKKFLDSQIADLQSRIADTQSQTDIERTKHREALLSRDRQISEKTTKLSDLERELNGAKDEKTSLEADLRHVKSVQEQQQKESSQRIDELTKELASIQDNRSENDSKYLDAQKSNRAQVAKIAELEQQIQTLEASINKKEFSLNQLEDKLKQEHLSEITTIKSELHLSEEQRQSSESELRVLQGKLSSHSREEAEWKNKVDELQQKNSKLREQISSGQEKVVADLRQKVSHHQTEAAALRKEMQESESSHKQQLQQRDSKISELTNEISFVRNTLALFEAESERRLTMIESSSQSKITSVEKEIRILREAQRSAEKSSRTVKSENVVLQEKISQLEESIENERSLRASEVEVATAASTQASENVKLEFQQQKKELEDELEELKKALQEAENEKKRKVEEQVNTHQNEIFNIKQQLAAAKADRDAAENKLAEVSKEADRVIELENQLLELEASKETLSAGHSSELGRLALQLQIAENQVKHQQQRIDLLINQQQRKQQQQQQQYIEGGEEQENGEEESTAVINDAGSSMSPVRKNRGGVGNNNNSSSPGSPTSSLLQHRITQLEHSLDEAQQSLRKTQGEYSLQLEQQRNRYQEQLSKLQSDISSLQQQREAESRSFKEKLRHLSEEHRAQMEKESAAAKSALDLALKTSKNNQQVVERTLKAKSTELELENAQAQRELALCNAKIESLQQSTNRATQRAAVAEDKLSALKQDHDTMNAEVASLRHARDDLSQTHQSTTTELNNQIQRQETVHRATIADLQSEHQSKVQQFNEKENSLKDALKTAHDNLESARRESKASLERVKALSDARVQELEEQLSERNSALHRAQLEHSTAIKSLEETYHNKLREVRDNALSMRSATTSYSEANEMAEITAQCRTLQLAAEQARQARDASERQLSLEQSRIVSLEAEISANGMKREIVEADYEALKSAHAKQVSQLQSSNSTLEGEVSALRQAIDRLNREVASEHDQTNEAAEKCKELGHRLHMSELKFREVTDNLGAERISHEQRMGDLERRLQEAIFEKDRLERSHQDEITRVRQQADRRVHELEVSLIANGTIDGAGGENGENIGGNLSASSIEKESRAKEMERLRDQISHQQIRVTELEKEVNLAKASAVRAEQDFDEAYDRIKDQSTKKVRDLEKEVASLRQSLHQAQREGKEAIERNSNSFELRTNELQQQLQQSISQQLAIRDEAKTNHDRLVRQHEVQITELEQKLHSWTSAADTASSDLAVSNMLKTQGERRVAELEGEIKRLNEEVDRHRDDNKIAIDRLTEMHKRELSDLEKQLEKERLHGLSSTKELSAQRDRVTSSMQNRVQELEKMLQQSNEGRSKMQVELESLRRTRDQQKVSLETKLSDLQSQLKAKDDAATRQQSEHKEQMERLRSHHQLNVLEAEKKSPSSQHLEALKDMEARIKTSQRSFEDKERSLRTTFEKELVVRFQKEQQLESENQNLRVAIQQLKNASMDTKRKLATYERQSRVNGMSLLETNNNNNNGSGTNLDDLSALDASRQRARMLASGNGSSYDSASSSMMVNNNNYSNSSIANNVRSLSGQHQQQPQQQRYNPNTSHNSNNGDPSSSSSHQIIPVEISHMFTHNKKRSQTPPASSSLRPKKPFTVL